MLHYNTNSPNTYKKNYYSSHFCRDYDSSRPSNSNFMSKSSLFIPEFFQARSKSPIGEHKKLDFNSLYQSRLFSPGHSKSMTQEFSQRNKSYKTFRELKGLK